MIFHANKFRAMKRFCIFATIFALLGLVSCDPVVDDRSAGSVLSADQLDLQVYNLSEGSNAIVLKNNTKGVGSYWDYGTGVSTRQCDTIVMPYVGDITVKFVGLCDGGQVKTERTVHISKIDHAVQKEWTLFAGTSLEGKKWTWDFEGTDNAVYGTGGWLAEFYPSWTVTAPEDLEDKDCSIVFNLNGGPNVEKVDANGKVLEKGTFSFDMTATKNNADDGTPWSIGELKLSGCTMLSGHAYYDTSNKITTFEILKLTEHEMILCWNSADAEAWSDATFWVLKSE